MAVEYGNLERLRRMLAIRSTSDFKVVYGGHGDTNGIAELTLAIIKDNTPADVDRVFFGLCVDMYVDVLNKTDRAKLVAMCWQPLSEHIKDKRIKARLPLLALAIIKHVYQCDLTDAQFAGGLGVDKSTYSRVYKQHADAVMHKIYYCLSVADGLAKDIKLKERA